MDKKRLEYYKKKLEAKREELVKMITRTEEEGRSADDDPTVDLADKAANSYTKEFLFGQTNHDRFVLQLVDDALARMKTANTANASTATRKFKSSAWKRCPGRATALPARKNRNRGNCKGQGSGARVSHRRSPCRRRFATICFLFS
jgi:DnaK suppressor protein